MSSPIGVMKEILGFIHMRYFQSPSSESQCWQSACK